MRRVELAVAAMSICCAWEAARGGQGDTRAEITSHRVNQSLERVSPTAGPASNICVSVIVDQGIWPRPLDAEILDLNEILRGELERLHENRGRSRSVRRSAAEREPRFLADTDFAARFCNDPDDIRIRVAYGPRPDGTPFLMSYEARGNGGRMSHYEDVNVAERIEAGQIARLTMRRDMRAVIVDDLRRRAVELSELTR